MTRIDTYSEYKSFVAELDLADFLAHRDDLRRAWHCAGSLFHLSDWVYQAHAASINAGFTYVDDAGVTQRVTKAEHFATSLGQQFPEFQLIRGIANASKHFVLKPVPPGRINPPGMPSHAANTYVSGSAFQASAFQSNAFQVGDVKLEAGHGDIEFAPLAQTVIEMWNNLFVANGW